jgi:hypothetical protein
VSRGGRSDGDSPSIIENCRLDVARGLEVLRQFEETSCSFPEIQNYVAFLREHYKEISKHFSLSKSNSCISVVDLKYLRFSVLSRFYCLLHAEELIVLTSVTSVAAFGGKNIEKLFLIKCEDISF